MYCIASRLTPSLSWYRAPPARKPKRFPRPLAARGVLPSPQTKESLQLESSSDEEENQQKREPESQSSSGKGQRHGKHEEASAVSRPLHRPQTRMLLRVSIVAAAQRQT